MTISLGLATLLGALKVLISLYCYKFDYTLYLHMRAKKKQHILSLPRSMR